MSQVTVVALMCHIVAPIQPAVCHEEVVFKEEMPMIACQMGQPAIAEWKEKSPFQGEQWKIEGFRCVAGDYVPKALI